MGEITLLNCDCMEYMKGCEDNAFDLAIVDPPYGIDAGNMQLGKGVGTESRGWEHHGWDIAIPKPIYFEQLMRASKNQIIWGANYFPNMHPTPCWLIWDKIQ